MRQINQYLKLIQVVLSRSVYNTYDIYICYIYLHIDIHACIC